MKHILATLAQATGEEIAQGVNWYLEANTFAAELAARAGIAIEQCAGVIAALSPSNPWLRNKANAKAMIEAYLTGEPPPRVSTFNTNRDKATAILNGAPVEPTLSGPKVIEFYRSIIGQNGVCVDGHAYAIWLGKRVPTTKTPSLRSGGLFEKIKRAYIKASKRSESVCGTKLTPTQLQAVTWVTYRRANGVIDI